MACSSYDHPVVCYTVTGYCNPSARLTRHPFMVWEDATERKLCPSKANSLQDCGVNKARRDRRSSFWAVFICCGCSSQAASRTWTAPQNTPLSHNCTHCDLHISVCLVLFGLIGLLTTVWITGCCKHMKHWHVQWAPAYSAQRLHEMHQNQ